MNVPAHIQHIVAADLLTLEPHLQDWVRAHLVAPRLVQVSLDPESRPDVSVWLVTDHTGSSDSNYRVVYDPADGQFGLEFTVNTGVQWLMGPRFTGFADAVRDM